MLERDQLLTAFTGAVVVLNVGLAVYATPLYDWGDNLDYLELSRSLLGYPVAHNVAHRSPLYAVLLAGFMLVFSASWFYKAVIVFQYLLLGLTAGLVYRIGCRIFSNASWAMLPALLFNLSFSTIFYANNFLTEILSVFLLVCLVWVVYKAKEEKHYSWYVLAGSLLGLVTLTRFSLLPMLVPCLLLMGWLLWQQHASMRRSLRVLAGFVLPYALLINAWCYYNWQHNGFYGLFPDKGLRISRNVVVSCIGPDDTVAEKHQPILVIFLQARASYLADVPRPTKGSLALFDQGEFLRDLYGGYPIYLEAVPALRKYFGLSDTSGEHELSQHLMAFYQEIAAQHRLTILKFRFLSFFNGFRAATSGAVPDRYGNINLNVLPAIFFKLYKIAVFGISFFVFFASFYFFRQSLQTRGSIDFYLLTLFMIVVSIWLINFAFVTAGDANRFKFPAEPFIIILFTYYFRLLYVCWHSPKKEKSLK